jgi:hypothetical protein
MRAMRLTGTAALCMAAMAGAAAAGGVACALPGRDVTIGEIRYAPQGEHVEVTSNRGRYVRLSPNTRVFRIERLRTENLTPGQRFLAVNGDYDRAAPYVLIFKNDADVTDVQAALGSQTR